MTGSDDSAKPAPMIPRATARALRLADTIVGSTMLAQRLFARGALPVSAQISTSLVNRFVTLADPRPLTSLIASRFATNAEHSPSPDLPLPAAPRQPSAAGRFAPPPELHHFPSQHAPAPNEPLLGELAALGWGQPPAPPTAGAPPPMARRSDEPPIQLAAPRPADGPVAQQPATPGAGVATPGATAGSAASSSAAASDALAAHTTEPPAALPSPDMPRSASVERSAVAPTTRESVERSAVSSAASAAALPADHAREEVAPLSRSAAPAPATPSGAAPAAEANTAAQSEPGNAAPSVPPLQLAAMRPPMLIQPMPDPLARMGIALPPASGAATPPSDTAAPAQFAQPLRRTPAALRETATGLPRATPAQRSEAGAPPAAAPGGRLPAPPEIARTSQVSEPAQPASALPPAGDAGAPNSAGSANVVRRETAASVDQGVAAAAGGTGPQDTPAAPGSILPDTGSATSSVARSPADGAVTSVPPETSAPVQPAAAEGGTAEIGPVLLRRSAARIPPVDGGTVAANTLPPPRPAPLALASLLVRRHAAGRAEAAGQAMPLLRVQAAETATPLTTRRTAATAPLPSQAEGDQPASGVAFAPDVPHAAQHAAGTAAMRAAETGVGPGSLPLLAQVAGTRGGAPWGGTRLAPVAWQPALASSILARTAAEDGDAPELPAARHAAWSIPGDEPAQGLEAPAPSATLTSDASGAEWGATTLPLPSTRAPQAGPALGPGLSPVSRRTSETVQLAAGGAVWRAADTPAGWRAGGLQPAMGAAPAPGWGQLPPLSVARGTVLQRRVEPQDGDASYSDSYAPLELARPPAQLFAQRAAEESASRAAEQAPAPAAPAAEQGGQSAADVERLARQVYEYLRRRLLIDQERRGRPFYE
jgi:hypothetical protein